MQDFWQTALSKIEKFRSVVVIDTADAMS